MKCHRKICFLCGMVILLLGACGGYTEQKEHPQVETEASFPFPEIPAMLTQPEERKAYLLEHYWDRFNFGDTTLVNNREVTEQGFVNQISLLADGGSRRFPLVEVAASDFFCPSGR